MEPEEEVLRINTVKLRERSRNHRRNHRRPSRPSGIVENTTEFNFFRGKRGNKLFMSTKLLSGVKYQNPAGFLRRSQSTKEVRNNLKESVTAGSGFTAGLNRSIFSKNRWNSVVAQLNRSFRGALNNADNQPDFVNSYSPAKIWRRSQSCRNIEKFFASRRYHFQFTKKRSKSRKKYGKNVKQPQNFLKKMTGGGGRWSENFRSSTVCLHFCQLWAHLRRALFSF